MKLLSMLLVSMPVVALATGDSEPRDCEGPGSYYPRGDLWPSEVGTPIQYRVQQDGCPGITLPTTKATIAEAFSLWMTTTCNGEALPLSFVAGPDYPTKDRGDDATAETFEHVIYWVTDTADWANIGVDSLTLALTTNLFITTTGYTVTSDIEFNAAYFDFRAAGEGCAVTDTGCYDLEHIATHELGHWLGFNHVLCGDAVMYPTATQAGTTEVLPSHEQAGVCAVYHPYAYSGGLSQWTRECGASNECVGGLCIIETLTNPYGYCTSTCVTHGDCPEAYSCMDYGDGTMYCRPGLPRACSDGEDNDGDGNTDYPADPGCENGMDWSEDDCGDGVCTGNEVCGPPASVWPPVDYALCLDDCAPGTDEVCCDGFIETGDCCEDGQTVSCYDGPGNTEGIGECSPGYSVCAAHQLTACIGQVTPADFELCDGLDEDCNGTADDSCIDCTPGEARYCYEGVAGTEGVGDCQGGTQVCRSNGWGPCAGQIVPSIEICDNRDNDCDGNVDNGVTCTQSPPPTTEPDEGCSCSGSPAAFAWLAVLGLWRRRRRS